MDQWVGAALTVSFGAPGGDEAHALVEGDRLAVLLVDLGRDRTVERDGMFDKRLADALAAISGVDEECLHAVVVEEHEADGPVVGIDREPKRRLRQKSLHLFPDCDPIFRSQEIMRRVDRIAPDLDGAIAIGGRRRPDTDHEGGIGKQRKGANPAFPLIAS